MADKSLYRFPSLLEAVFPLDEEEIGFWAALRSGAPEGTALEIGGGSGALAARLGGVVNLEPEAALVAKSPGPAVRGSVLQAPFRSGGFAFVYSRLFAVGYALGQCGGVAGEAVLARELARLMAPDGRLAIEVPMAWKPRSLRWISERSDGPPEYVFTYGDQLRRSELGGLLESTIEVRDQGEVYRLEVPLFVFAVEGIREWLEGAGYVNVRFCASYDLKSVTEEPPEDVLRGVVLAEMGY